MDKPASPCLSQEDYEEILLLSASLDSTHEEYEEALSTRNNCKLNVEDHDREGVCLSKKVRSTVVWMIYFLVVACIFWTNRDPSGWILIALGCLYPGLLFVAMAIFFVTEDCKPSREPFFVRKKRSADKILKLRELEKAEIVLLPLQNTRSEMSRRLLSIYTSALEEHKSRFLFRVRTDTPGFLCRLQEYSELIDICCSLTNVSKERSTPYQKAVHRLRLLLPTDSTDYPRLTDHIAYLASRTPSQSASSSSQSDRSQADQPNESKQLTAPVNESRSRGDLIDPERSSATHPRTKHVNDVDQSSGALCSDAPDHSQVPQAAESALQTEQVSQITDHRVHVGTSRAKHLNVNPDTSFDQFHLFDSVDHDVNDHAEAAEVLFRGGAKHVDWEALRSRFAEIGFGGEILVLRLEADHLASIGRTDLAEKVQHASKEVGDGLGYDILSYFGDGREKYIEVKTTTVSLNEPLYLSRRELELLTNNPQSAFVYRILTNSEEVKLAVFSGEDFFNEYELDPIRYLVEFKDS